jgi:leucyl aminopeptidase
MSTGVMWLVAPAKAGPKLPRRKLDPGPGSSPGQALRRHDDAPRGGVTVAAKFGTSPQRRRHLLDNRARRASRAPTDHTAMSSSAYTTSSRGAAALTLLREDDVPRWLRSAPATHRRWLQGSGFRGRAGELALLPADAAPEAIFVFAGDGSSTDFWRLASLPTRLPEGVWQCDDLSRAGADRLALAWGIGAYQFTRYRKADRAPATLAWPRHADRAAVERAVNAAALARDLINTPAQDMGPSALAQAAAKMARRLGMKSRVVVGDALLKNGYRLIHAVGRAAADAPRLIDLSWGNAKNPKVTLVGKGVCFDTGGLDIKTADGMKLMKKDMGGAAHALALAQMIVQAELPVRLRVLVPAVENAIAGNALRPLDVITSKKGLTVEIGNTDAEGRLILADALDEACRDKPALLVDLATLTGAARVALGPDLPALFVDDEPLAAELLAAAEREADPMWRMPLWQPYRPRLKSNVADLNNVADGPMAGAVNAALFLQEFVAAGVPWIHLDLFGWNPWPAPGRPVGAQAQCLRALFSLIQARFAAPARHRR